MRYGVLILATLLAYCELSPAGDPTFTTSETEATLEALVETLEARVMELESELARMKHSQQRAVIGSSLLGHDGEPTDQSPVCTRTTRFLLANGSMRVDQNGIIRDSSGRPCGYWGFDFSNYSR